jgi:hypothetical protein
MSRRVLMVLCIAAGVLSVFVAKALGVESVIAQAATVVAVMLLCFGAFTWSRGRGDS